ncbi:hypothetical protein EVAR_51767_1 [Eumeta japonica]|uniref:Uncharacterized protein n=1 Tax=Eumeta variegata TaxID=151549 RepID=A0A4C1XDF5_EUMVA|nr:hypothetical protein EVAR_51767_1 [Eumeta japonica]
MNFERVRVGLVRLLSNITSDTVRVISRAIRKEGRARVKEMNKTSLFLVAMSSDKGITRQWNTTFVVPEAWTFTVDAFCGGRRAPASARERRGGARVNSPGGHISDASLAPAPARTRFGSNLINCPSDCATSTCVQGCRTRQIEGFVRFLIFIFMIH